MSVTDEVVRILRRGEFSAAYELLSRNRLSSDVDFALWAEVLHFLGKTDEAEPIATRLISAKGTSPEVVAKCTGLLADIRWHSGDFKSGIELYQRASDIAENTSDITLRCRAAAQLLEHLCDNTGFDGSLALANLVRRTAAHSGDPQIHAIVHLTFGRVEGKVAHFSVATRHFELGRKVLAVEPSKYLMAALDLSESIVLWLAGDITGAIEVAERGGVIASEIGWSRGRMAAGANLAWLYVCAGRVEDARAQIRAASLEPFLGPSFRLALADTTARASLALGDDTGAAEILAEHEGETEIQAWYRLTAEQTRIQLLLRAGRWAEALERATRDATAARKANVEPLATSFQLARLEALMGLGQVPDPAELPIAASYSDWPLGLVGALYGVIGKAFERLGQPDRATEYVERATRILEVAGDVSALQQIRQNWVSRGKQAPVSSSGTQTSHHLDSAAALLELAGHPHILGREAFAILQDAGCVDAVALGAAGARGVRLVSAHGWTGAEALAAFKRAPPDDLVLVGEHRDEQWQILVRPRADLDHRCTLAAIRKLVAAARTLDQFRRDEKQRAALWPAEALEGDAESLWISERSAELLTIARRIANNSLPVLLTGETGTGKEMLARVIHRASERAERPLQPFNCTAVPREMLESQLFGYRKGSFTGAEIAFPGVFRAAAGGTLFLDEIGDVGLDVQPKLLRVLEQQEVHPLGEPHAVKVDVRIIAATNRNLDELVAQGRFREDLLYRLKVLHLHLPPLRERREEIPALVQHYIRKYSDEQRKGQIQLSDETLEYLLLYSWPGNIRQLANEVRRMIALAEPESTLTPALLSSEIQASRRTVAVTDPSSEPEIRLRLDQPLPVAVATLEQTLVRRALERSHGRVEEAARLLGISRKGLFLKRRRWGLREAS